MTYKGRIKNGVVVFDPEVRLPEGIEVEVTLPEKSTEERTWGEVFGEVIGKAEGLPEDSSVNHDHYLYDTPRK